MQLFITKKFGILFLFAIKLIKIIIHIFLFILI
jgi:hypothetical protein